MKGSKAERRAYASEMPVQGGKALYKVAIIRQGVRGWRATPRPRPRKSRQPGSQPPNL
jgi:hypothetical protein